MTINYKEELSRELKALAQYLSTFGEEEWSSFCHEASEKVLEDDKCIDLVWGNFAPTTEFDDFTVSFSRKCGDKEHEVTLRLQECANKIEGLVWKIRKR